MTPVIGRTNRNEIPEAGFARPVGIVAGLSDTDQKNRAAVGSGLTADNPLCINYYMARKKTRYKTMTEALRHEIEASNLSFKRLEKETGVLRQSLMTFARGEASLRLDKADKLLDHFGLEITRRKGK